MPALEEGQKLDLDGAPWLVDKETQPPSRISQGKLLEMMEELGLGTKATRPDIIQKLYDRGYVYNNPPEPSETGIAMYRAFKEHVLRMATPEMTAELERDMDEIAAGKTDREEVLKISREMLHGTYDDLFSKREDLAKVIWAGMDEDKFIGPCKVCEEAGRKHEDGSPNRLRIIEMQAAASGSSAARARTATTPRIRTRARSRGRCPAAATSSGGSRSAARSAARRRGSRSRASAAVPGTSA